jgi:hypothetical protein
MDNSLKTFWDKYELKLSPLWTNRFSFFTWCACRPYSFANEENTLKAIIEDRKFQLENKPYPVKNIIINENRHSKAVNTLLWLTEQEKKTITGLDVKNALKKAGVIK